MLCYSSQMGATPINTYLVWEEELHADRFILFYMWVSAISWPESKLPHMQKDNVLCTCQ